MIFKTCLLVSDDPDDHTDFSEAINEISNEIILISIINYRKAMEMLKTKLHIPGYIFLDLSMYDLDAGEFLKSINANADLRDIPMIIYGEDSDFEKVKNNKFSGFYNRNSGFTGLKEFLKKIFTQ